MSSIKLKHASGNGVSITAPSSNPAADRTLELPSDADGIIAKTDASGNLAVTGDLTVDTDTLKVDSSNNRVGIGDSSPTKPLTVGTTTPSILLDDQSGRLVELIGGSSSTGPELRTAYAEDLRFGTNSTERMRFASNGKILINRTNEDGSGVINLAVNSAGFGISFRSGSTGSQTHCDFGNPNGIVGKIQTSGTSTSYETSSDYRLKENATAISDGITRLKTLKPYRFNFKADATTTVDGFFAHEVTAVPEAISGTKDEVDEDNNPVYQGIDQSKLVPLLVAALQELNTKVETLETEKTKLQTDLTALTARVTSLEAS